MPQYSSNFSPAGWLVKGCIAFCEAASIKKSSTPAARIYMAVTHLQVCFPNCNQLIINPEKLKAPVPGIRPDFPLILIYMYSISEFGTSGAVAENHEIL